MSDSRPFSPTERAEDASRPANRLAGETSAYLRQHMYNPVDWYPWGEEAFARASELDRPLLVSIGYSACHWCHVMEHESFEDPDTAELMNRLFVCIKVDREERPDVDQIYMDTVVRLTGHGGWPLTVFCTPDGRPFHGGTYFPPTPRHGLPSFRELLTSVGDAYRTRLDEVERSAGEILEALAQRLDGEVETPPDLQSIGNAVAEIMRSADTQNGGFGSGPKFPTPTNLELLLTALDYYSGDSAQQIRDQLTLTAREMARRGLYDQIGGGFHRYCVDGEWQIPHFEKMLYDQGLLLRVYAELSRRTSDPEFAWPIRETAAYLRREMQGPEGGFYASQDADSEGVEGSYYVWTPAQIEQTLGDAAAAFCSAYGVTQAGNFEHATTHLIDHARAPREHFEAERERLLAVRERRGAPATDRKRVAAWNGYAISGLARSGSLLDDAAMLQDATRAADFVCERLLDERGRLLRIWNEGRARVPAFLDDHAALLDAFLDLYRAGAGDRFLAAALRFADEIAARFFDPADDDLYFTPADGEKLAHRPRSDHDGATPHAAGLATLGLLRTASLAGRPELQDVADRVIRRYAYALERAPHGYPTLLRAVALAGRGLAVAVVVGDPDGADTLALAGRARHMLLPEDGVVVAAPGSDAPGSLDAGWLQGRPLQNGRATVYLCRGTRCSLPITDPEKLADPAGVELLPAE